MASFWSIAQLPHRDTTANCFPNQASGARARLKYWVASIAGSSGLSMQMSVHMLGCNKTIAANTTVHLASLPITRYLVAYL
jgi:hypothetical protein